MHGQSPGLNGKELAREAEHYHRLAVPLRFEYEERLRGYAIRGRQIILLDFCHLKKINGLVYFYLKL